MNQPDTILNELRELSPTLAAIPRVNIFKVPEGYFETLPALLLLQAVGDGIHNSAVPAGYFDGLANTIMARIKSETVNPTIEHSGVLTSISNENVFAVPQGYFDDLATNIMARIKNESVDVVHTETNNISTLVAGIGNTNVFSVPQGYFNELADNIIKQTAPAKVVRFNSRRTILKYAAAAVVTGFIAMSAFLILNKGEQGKSIAANDGAMIEAQSILKTNSFDATLSSVSDADIVSFLKSKGQDVDAALVASLTEDDKTLPEADDYLFNENTLDEVLKNLDLNN